MRHQKAGRKLGRTSSHKEAMLRNMVTSLFKHEKITTTDTKAKELRRVAEKMISLGKDGSLHARRQAAGIVRESGVVKKLFEDISARYKDRSGGYTRIVKAGFRVGDNAPLAVIELIPQEIKKEEKPKAKSRKKAAKK
ncbi:MAG TPA: 50S ribosomal protein L17 [Syntrophales bacterium]|nr:50S ribosomal protein L17 [Syntrophales bacterium]HRT62730.1 50S ribosomal protein L17 [Syntrophales bacterium]